ncbi:MAG: hypothetical protein Q8933_17695 [Bacteroidota bacterium]|nr:hypothetical protein [Bacteroidota bacterium]MDP4196830.1 hypothetical protein [Bacteroidota bacterium]
MSKFVGWGLLYPIFLTIGTLIIRTITLGKYPPECIGERLSNVIIFLGAIASFSITIFILAFIFR